MSLTDKDREWIADLIATANERVYRSIKDNALSELATEMRAGFAARDRTLGELATEMRAGFAAKDRALGELATEMRAGFASLDRKLDDLHGVLNGVSADVEYLKGRVDP